MADATTTTYQQVNDETGEVTEVTISEKDLQEDIRTRTILSDTYAFVRSQALNRALLSFTLDHYLLMAQEELGTREIVNADDEILDRRPTKLGLLSTLESDFQKVLKQVREKAKRKDAEDAAAEE